MEREMMGMRALERDIVRGNKNRRKGGEREKGS